jgi:hypothetical protein
MTEETIHKIKVRLRATAEKKFPNDKERQERYMWGTIQRIKRGA